VNKFPKVFVIILNYNGKDFIMDTLRSVFKLEYPNFEIIIVDNNSQDRSPEMIKNAFPKIIFIKNSQNLGFSAGNNVGIKYALERGADFVLLLNYDTQAKGDFLTSLIETAESDSKIGIASPVIVKENNEVWFSGGKIDWWRMRTTHETKERKEDYLASDFISGCAMLIRAEVFKKVGLLSEDYFLYYEDADFSCKAKKAGYKLAISVESRITHMEKSEENKKNKTYWLVISGLIFFRKNSPFWFRPWIFIYTILRRIKNRSDIKKEKGELALVVQKAYRDFSRIKHSL
jgi:GT2 family glycosyltransferase